MESFGRKYTDANLQRKTAQRGYNKPVNKTEKNLLCVSEYASEVLLLMFKICVFVFTLHCPRLTGLF